MKSQPFLLTDHTAERLIASAILAPSSHNTQPWRFKVREGGIDLFADRSRTMQQNDADGRELTISCGCALYNLRVAAAWMGLQTHVQVMEAWRDDDLLAHITFSHAAMRSPEADLCAAIYTRHTNRKHFDSTPLSPQLVRKLQTAATEEHSTLEVLASNQQRLAVAALIAEGDTEQWANPEWRRELANWMKPSRDGDGLKIGTLTAPLVQLTVRSVNMGGRIADQDREIMHEAPLLTVLTTRRDGPSNWLHAGQALERMLLTAQLEGVQASFLNQPIQVAKLRPHLRDITGGVGQPQMLIRWGVPLEQVPASPRRPLASVLETPRVPL